MAGFSKRERSVLDRRLKFDVIAVAPVTQYLSDAIMLSLIWCCIFLSLGCGR